MAGGKAAQVKAGFYKVLRPGDDEKFPRLAITTSKKADLTQIRSHTIYPDMVTARTTPVTIPPPGSILTCAKMGELFMLAHIYKKIPPIILRDNNYGYGIILNCYTLYGQEKFMEAYPAGHTVSTPTNAGNTPWARPWASNSSKPLATSYKYAEQHMVQSIPLLSIDPDMFVGWATFHAGVPTVLDHNRMTAPSGQAMMRSLFARQFWPVKKPSSRGTRYTRRWTWREWHRFSLLR
ncbi:hypothetical protein LTR56_015654 [Elasticomyces elasticus]|nr:hypothetical protein LTR22_022222 [Elasticomyces elasticus]KAK3633740.1 hypothetical protein LTR56_015654 [Elasticomyces elasticus]